jgi:hypothetical protein
MKSLYDNDDDWSFVVAASTWDQVKDGSLGFAFNSILLTLGIQVNTADYDFTC